MRSNGKFRTVSRYEVVPGVLTRLLAYRAAFMREMWRLAKVSTFPQIRVEDLPGLGDIIVSGWADRPDRLMLAALALTLDCRTFFEIGTFTGRTTWTVVHNNPHLEGFSLDLPGPHAVKEAALEITDHHLFESWRRAGAIVGTPEQSRITLLTGDSGTFDYSPYRNLIDLVYIDGSHSYSYVKSDTEAALEMLSPGGTIVWDDPYYPGVWRFLHENSTKFRPRLIAGTSMVIYSRHPKLAAAFDGARHSDSKAIDGLASLQLKRMSP